MNKEKSTPKVVIDTNLLVAGFFNKKSHSAKILKMAKKGEIKVFWTRKIKKEGKFILGNITKSLSSKRRFKRRARRFKKDLKKIFQNENKIKYPPKIKIVKEDPDDNKFLSCAKKAKVDLIISNDSHLLNIGKFDNIPILTSKQAFKKIST